MNRSALLVLLLLAIPCVAEARASGRAATVVPTCVHPRPSCYPLHCNAQLKPQNRPRYGRLRCDLFMSSAGATFAPGAKPTCHAAHRMSVVEA